MGVVNVEDFGKGWYGEFSIVYDMMLFGLSVFVYGI